MATAGCADPAGRAAIALPGCICVVAPPPRGAALTECDLRFVDPLASLCHGLLVAVTFRIGRVGVPVVAEFTSPEPRTISMHILEGEGSGSVVETHAAPLGVQADGGCRTAVIEAVIAHSDRPRFAHALRGARLLTPLMRGAATRLWRDDLVYAERLFTLRNPPAIATRTADLRPPEAESVAPPTD